MKTQSALVLALALGLPAVAVGAPAHLFHRRGHHRFAGIQTVLVTYHGGELLRTSRTLAIFWGPEWARPDFAGDKIDGIDSLLAGFGGSRYAENLTEYSWRRRAKVTNASTYLGHALDLSDPPSLHLSIDEILQDTLDEACRVASDHPDPQALYVVYPSTGAGDDSTFCALHTFGDCHGTPIQAAWVPNLDGVRGCGVDDAWTRHSPGLAAIANATAHELAETITDPRGSGWFDLEVEEIADKCAFVFAHVVRLANRSRWKLQTLWSNAAYLAGTGDLGQDRTAGCVQ